MLSTPEAAETFRQLPEDDRVQLVMGWCNWDRRLSADSATVAVLMQDPCYRVRWWAPFALATTPEQMLQLAQDHESMVRQKVAQNNSCATAEALAILSQDEMPWVRRNVAEHPNTDPETLAKLLQDPDREVAQTAAAHPQIPKVPLAMWQLVHGSQDRP